MVWRKMSVGVIGYMRKSKRQQYCRSRIWFLGKSCIWFIKFKITLKNQDLVTKREDNEEMIHGELIFQWLEKNRLGQLPKDFGLNISSDFSHLLRTIKKKADIKYSQLWTEKSSKNQLLGWMKENYFNSLIDDKLLRLIFNWQENNFLPHYSKLIWVTRFYMIVIIDSEGFLFLA